MKTNQLKAGSLLTYLQMGLGIIISIIYTPIMISVLGKSEYGLYNTVSSTIAMLAILNLGFSSSYIKYYTKYKKNNDTAGESKLNGLYIIIFTIIGIIALLCGLYLSSHLNLIFANGLREDEYHLAKTLVIFLSISTAINFAMSVFSSIVMAHERYVYLKAVSCIKTIFSPLITLPVLLLGYGSVGMVIITVLLNIIADILFLYYAVAKLKVRFAFCDFDKGILRDITIYSGFIAINIIVDQINMNADKVLLGRYKGTTSVTIYTVGFTLYSYYVSFSTALSSVFTPKIHRIVAQTANDECAQNKQLTSLFIRVGRIQFYVLALVMSGLVFFGKPFLARWAGISEYKESYWVALLLIIPSIIPLCQNIGIEIQRAKNMQKFRAITYLFMALVNLILSISLCQLYGAVGNAAATAFSLLIANGLFMNIYYHRKIKIGIIEFWTNIGHISLGLILPCAFGLFVIKVFEIKGYQSIAIAAISYSVIYFLSMWFISMNREEKDLIIGIPKKLCHNKKKCNNNGKDVESGNSITL